MKRKKRNEKKKARRGVAHGNTYYVGTPLQLLRLLLRRLILRLRQEPGPPGYPYADKPAPVRRGPKGRSGAAVVDLDDEEPRR